MTVHVHVLWPVCTHNSISNIVVSLTIHDDKYLHIYETIVEGQRLLSLCLCLCFCFCRDLHRPLRLRLHQKHETIVEGHEHIHVHFHTHTHTHTHTHIHIGEGEEEGDKPNQLIADSLRSVPQDC